MRDDELGKTFSDGEVIIAEGSVGEAMYSIQSGSARVVKATPTGETELATLEAGDIFGEMSLFDRKPRSASVIARGQTRVLRIDRSKLLSTISRDPTIVLKTLESMSRRIRNLNSGLAELQRKEGGPALDRLDVKTTCEAVLSQALALVGADCGYVALSADKGEAPTVCASAGEPRELLEKLADCICPAADSIESGKPGLIEEVAADQRCSSLAPGIASILCVPLLFIFRPMGAIVLAGQSRRFTEEDLRIVESLGGVAAIAVQHAKTLSRFTGEAERVISDATSAIIIPK